jgi:DNA primase large subunit
MKIYFSGHKGFHLIVPKEVLGIEPNKNLNGIFKTIAEQVKTFSIHKTVDLQIYDNKRLFRVPNSIHGKTMLYKIILTPDELHSLTENEIKELAKQPRSINLSNNLMFNPVAHNQYLEAIKTYEKQKKELDKKEKGYRYKKILNITPECISNILENGAEEGTRNITIACLTSFYKASGKTLEEINDLLTEWNSKNTKPTPIREMKATIKSIFFGNKSYGCNTLQTLTNCNKSDCKLKKQFKGQRRNVPHAIRIN